MARLFTIAAAIIVAGCATTVPPGAENVVLHEETGTMTQGCKRLGPVATEVSLWKMPTIDAGHVQAQDNLRAAAFSQYGADTVVQESMDTQVTRVLAQGTAYRCKG